MGVKLNSLFESKKIKIAELSGKAIAIDAFNWIFQFLTTIRMADGSYLTDSKGRVTTHLNGLFYRSVSLLENAMINAFLLYHKVVTITLPSSKRNECSNCDTRPLSFSFKTLNSCSDPAATKFLISISAKYINKSDCSALYSEVR